MTIPEDLNVELLLEYLPYGSCKVELCGLHKRNSYNDIVEMKEDKSEGMLRLGIARNSLYNSLPEYMFHPIDRFSNLPRLEEKERFAEELEKQKKEIELAYRYFSPMDVELLFLKMEARKRLRPITETNKVLTDILGDRLTEQQKKNRFIMQVVPFLPYCKLIRGNKTLFTILLRKVFLDEGLIFLVREKSGVYCDQEPRYADGIEATLGDSYVGNVYDETVVTYELHYWSVEECNEHFLTFVDDLEIFRTFLEDWFLSVEQVLHFDITNDEPPLRLSDDIMYNYLDYNTNI